MTNSATPAHRHSVLKKMASSFSSGEGSDFTIHSHGHSFPVHKYVLKLHSGYFRTLFNNPRFTENDSNSVTLDDDNVDPHSLRALLQCFYEDDYDFDYDLLPRSVGKENDHINELTFPHDYYRYHVGVSVLADRFQVEGIDDVVASKLYAKMNELNRSYNRFRPLRTDKEFVDGIQKVYENAKRSSSDNAMTLIVSLLNDQLHKIRKLESYHSLLNDTSGLLLQMCAESMNDGHRIQCPGCSRVERIDVAKLEGNQLPNNVSKSAMLQQFNTEHEKKCSGCKRVFTILWWMRRWYETGV